MVRRSPPRTPPLRSLDISALTPGNSRRQETVSLYADLDGFTNYVDRHVENEPEDVIKALHVIRSEMDAVISADFTPYFSCQASSV